MKLQAAFCARIFRSIIFLFSFSLQAIVFEQVPFVYKDQTRFVWHPYEDKLNFDINVMISGQRTSESLDPYAEPVPLFGRYGPVDFGAFANSKVGSSFDDSSELFQLATHPKTKAFKDLIKNSSFSEKIAYGAGDFEMFEASIAGTVIHPDLAFYVSAILPFRQVSCKNIRFAGRAGKESSFSSFVNDNFGLVLDENGFEPLSDDVIIKGLGDLKVLLGWQGKEDFHHFLVKSSWFNLSIGVIFPFSSILEKQSKKYFFHAPLGASGSLGAMCKFNAGVTFKDNYELSIFGESSAFFKKRNYYSVNYAKDALFFNFFQPQELDLKVGSCWSLGGQLKSKLLFDGINILIGYSYHSQEESSYRQSMDSPEVLPSLYDLKKKSFYPQSNPITLKEFDRMNSNSYFLGSSMMNKDPRLQRSYSHVLHIGIIAEPNSDSSWYKNATCSICYSRPIWGKSCFICNELAGQFGLGFSMNF